MPAISQWFFKAAVVFLILGLMMGLQMSITENYNVTGAHAHTNLAGWVTGALFGLYYALNPQKAETRLARTHFFSYIFSVAVMAPGLYFWSMGYEIFAPFVAISAVVAFASVLLFAYIVYAPAQRSSVPRSIAAE